MQFLASNLNTFLAAARKRPEIAGVSTTFLGSVPQQFINVDRDKVIKQAVPVADVYRTIQAFMGGLFINYFNRFGRQWQVYIEAEGDYRTKAENVGQFYVRNQNGGMVPLSALTSFQPLSGPEFTMRYNLFRSAQINGSAAPGYSSDQATAALEEVFAQTMPPEMGFDYIGMSYQEKKAQQGVPPAAIFGLSLLFVFLILSALYESWTLPFTVLLSTPVAVFGAFAVLWLRRVVLSAFLPPFMVQIETDVYSQIGLVMLIGLAAKNAILIVEFAKDEYEQGKPLVDAALTGARLRLRPILMTSLAFIFGCIPLWTAVGCRGGGPPDHGHNSHRRHVGGQRDWHFLCPGGVLRGGEILRCREQEALLRARCLFRPRKIRGQETTRMRTQPILPVLLVILGFACGCAVGPNYKRPAVNVPPDYRGLTPEEAAKGDARSLADEKWWEVFQDEQLKELVKTALQQNYDVRIAATRILQAQAQLGITRADQFPTIAGGVAGSEPAQSADKIFRCIRNQRNPGEWEPGLGPGLLGQVSPRHRSSPRRSGGHRVGPAGSHYCFDREPGRRLLPASRAGLAA